MTTRPLDHYCGVCRYALDREPETVDGQTITEMFVHPLAIVEFIEPHDPLPVPLAELINPNMVCDFCTSPAVRWAYRLAAVVTETHLPDGSTRHNDFGGWWAACVSCGLELDTGNVARLVRRTLRSLEFDDPGSRRATVDVLYGLYGALLLRGVIQRAPVPGDH